MQPLIFPDQLLRSPRMPKYTKGSLQHVYLRKEGLSSHRPPSKHGTKKETHVYSQPEVGVPLNENLCHWYPQEQNSHAFLQLTGIAMRSYSSPLTYSESIPHTSTLRHSVASKEGWNLVKSQRCVLWNSCFPLVSFSRLGLGQAFTSLG